MRFTAAIAAVPLLVVLLTALAWQSFNGEAELYDQALGQIERLAMQEASLERDVLSARTGILRNYDSMIAEVREMYSSADRLKAIAAGDHALSACIAAIEGKVPVQEDLVERYKTENALLQNSLAYFARFGTAHAPTTEGTRLPEPVRGVASAMLRLTLDTSQDNARIVDERLNELARAPEAGGPEATEALLAHGRLLRTLLPETDQTIRALLAASSKDERTSLRALVLDRQLASRAVARNSRLVLYGASVLLLGLLAYVALQLQARARALRRSAAFEGVIAQASVNLMGTRGQNVDEVIRDALRGMAQCIGAERAYFISSTRKFVWSETGISFPTGWPDHAPSVVDRLSAGMPDAIVQVRHLRRLRPGSDKALLQGLGLQGFACTIRTTEDGSRMLLGFDAVTHPSRISSDGELGLLHLGLDVIANALGRRTFEQERARLESRLQQARRLETVGALAGGITHNFNNILGAILGYTEIAGEHLGDRSRYMEVLQEIRRAGLRAREIVEQILTFARHREVQLRPVPIKALIEEATSLLSASLPSAVELRVSGDIQAVVSGEPAQLQQVILNLCNNAAQAMDGVGVIELRSDVVDLPRERVLGHGRLRPGMYLRLSVTDQGTGIDPVALSRIFEPFFTTRGDGTGLGLATTREIVAEHGGGIEVRSELGAGTTFDVWLPCELERCVCADVAPIAHGQGETVMIVEEDPARLLHSEELLAALGFEPIGYHSIQEAQRANVNDPGRFDAAVIGHAGSNLAVLRFTSSLRKQYPSAPIVLAAASVGGWGATRLADSGVSDVVHWPPTATELLTSLTRGLRRSRRSSTPAAKEPVFPSSS